MKIEMKNSIEDLEDEVEEIVHKAVANTPPPPAKSWKIGKKN